MASFLEENKSIHYKNQYDFWQIMYVLQLRVKLFVHCTCTSKNLLSRIRYDLNCFFPLSQKGSCDGRLMGSQLSRGPHDCLRLCSINPNCHWFSFDRATKKCNFTKECVVNDSDNAVSGRKECHNEYARRWKKTIK